MNKYIAEYKYFFKCLELISFTESNLSAAAMENINITYSLRFGKDVTFFTQAGV